MKYLLLTLFAWLPLASAAEKPSVLILLSDDQSWTDYGFMGHPDIKTPCLDKLASQSVVFQRGYVPTALCRPSLMSLITGQYASTHGVTGNDPARSSWKPGTPEANEKRAELISFIDNFDTLPKLLGEQGYLSFQSGKWWEGNFRRGGFTSGMTRGFPEKGGRHGDDGLKIGRAGVRECKDFIDLAKRENKPFFLWYAPMMPHSPHTPPEAYLEKYAGKHPPSVAKYYAMCEWFDATCGELVDYLDEKGLRDDTIIVYLSDNGWIQDPASGNYLPRSKRSPYEGGTRQPIMFSWPGHLKPGTRSDLVLSLDIFPTIVAAAGARPPKREVPGVNLLPYMEDGKAVPREAIFGESFAHDIVDLHDPEKTLTYRWCIRGRWKLLLSYHYPGAKEQPAEAAPIDQPPQLFDLQQDPHETTNLAARHPDLVREMEKMLDDWYPVKKAKAVLEVPAE
jgi:arylsulfatase A-like enzyme